MCGVWTLPLDLLGPPSIWPNIRWACSSPSWLPPSGEDWGVPAEQARGYRIYGEGHRGRDPADGPCLSLTLTRLLASQKAPSGLEKSNSPALPARPLGINPAETGPLPSSQCPAVQLLPTGWTVLGELLNCFDPQCSNPEVRFHLKLVGSNLLMGEVSAQRASPPKDVRPRLGEPAK